MDTYFHLDAHSDAVEDHKIKSDQIMGHKRFVGLLNGPPHLTIYLLWSEGKPPLSNYRTWVIPFTCWAFKLILHILNWLFSICSTTWICSYLQAIWNGFLSLFNRYCTVIRYFNSTLFDWYFFGELLSLKCRMVNGILGFFSIGMSYVCCRFPQFP